MDSPPKDCKRLTDNQRRVLTDLLKKHDKALRVIIEKAKHTHEANSVSDKLSTNLDFKKKVILSFEKLKFTCIKQGVYLPIFEQAEISASHEINGIITGQPRHNVREHINSARCAFFYSLLQDDKNVNFEFDPWIN